jgi:hypothetical protein
MINSVAKLSVFLLQEDESICTHEAVLEVVKKVQKTLRGQDLDTLEVVEYVKSRFPLRFSTEAAL